MCACVDGVTGSSEGAGWLWCSSAGVGTGSRSVLGQLEGKAGEGPGRPGARSPLHSRRIATRAGGAFPTVASSVLPRL